MISKRQQSSQAGRSQPLQKVKTFSLPQKLHLFVDVIAVGTAVNPVALPAVKYSESTL